MERMATKVKIADVVKIFGDEPDGEALELLRAGCSKEEIKERTGCTVVGPRADRDRIPGIDIEVGDGDTYMLYEAEAAVFDVPGHTRGHIAYWFPESTALFCGDTLFNAGAGNCHNGGHPHELYQTFVRQLAKLPDTTRIYPGHDYWENNLGFTLDREPDNAKAAELLDEVSGRGPDDALVSTLALEKEINTFFRLHSPTVIARLREAFPDLPEEPDEKTVFLKLRELRNAW